MSTMPRRLLLLLLLALLPACSSIEVKEQDVFQNKPTVTPATFQREGIQLENIFLRVRDGTRLNAWHFTQPGAAGTVVFFGGNGFFMTQSAGYIRTLTAYPVNVFMTDYRGYGRSEGAPSVAKLKSDAIDVLDYVRTNLEVPLGRLVIHGHSIGTFMALHTAQERTVAGVVLENPLTTAEDWADHLIPWYLRFFLSLEPAEALQGEDNLARVKDVEAPLLVVGGAEDVIADPEMARALSEAAAPSWKRLVLVEGGGHNQLFKASAYRQAYAQLLGEALGVEIKADTSKFDAAVVKPLP